MIWNSFRSLIVAIRRHLGLLSVIVTLALFAAQASAKTYHVDVSRGNDGYPGTESEPFRTIKRASTMLEPGDKAIIHEGIYHEQILGGRSGLEGAPIIYEGVDQEKVILRGSVKVNDWRKVGMTWVTGRVKPITQINAFVMVDEKRRLKRVSSPVAMPDGSFYLSPEGFYSIRLWGNANPNTDHVVEAYEYDLAFNNGNRWGGTAKSWIVLRNMTLEKYGTYGISSAPSPPSVSSHWELDHLTFQYNFDGVFCCLDDWYVHDCKFIRNVAHACQIDGARVKFVNNICKENEWFGPSTYGGAGVLIGPNESAYSCVVQNNTFENNGAPDGYGCAVYLEGKTHNNLIENNLIIGEAHAGIGFYGGSYNTVINNVLVDISPKNSWNLTAAFVVHHSLQDEPTQSVGNIVAHNTIWGCPFPIAVSEPTKTVVVGEMNLFVNNFFARCRSTSASPNLKGTVLERNGWYMCPEGEGSKDALVGNWVKNLANRQKADGLIRLDSSPRIVTDPRLRNPSAGDFHLKPDSPLVDAGVLLDKVKIDKDGNSRPRGLFPDIGAYEYSDALDKARH